MPVDSKQPFEHFRFHTNGRFMNILLTPDQEYIKSIRNKFATQFALVRGDNQVTLEYDPQPADSLVQHVNRRRILRADLAPDTEYTEAYGHFWHPDKNGDNHGVTGLPPDLAYAWPRLKAWDGFHLSWVKILGAGGFGYATLWEAVFEDGSSTLVVIKMPKPGSADAESIQDELAWHKKYDGALHTVQAVDLNEIVRAKRMAPGGSQLARIRGPTFSPRFLNVMVLEYADHGNLYDMLAKLSYTQARLSNKVLWQLWDCLVRGVASVSRQRGILERELKGNEQYGLDQVLAHLEAGGDKSVYDFLEEVFDSHNVHFDLEEQNVLVGSDPSHYGSPVLKARCRSYPPRPSSDGFKHILT
ncbi:hypothetical protein JDV02_009460 [Purpureocillium takamizusanense]|uniref:Protein kinase domain-containing protein n=1 Tax=Purpureocillium takamizusanense TaxID=2060973 RepID=A0A9Q8QNX4_9HYPO|nr:uncharacterized protein JDV02_009460 [Purpureocillium takamizusanense]UNI23653.1 hypothetical protein JDV02_009460 [Purpureocillium takamizusanense]